MDYFLLVYVLIFSLFFLAIPFIWGTEPVNTWKNSEKNEKENTEKESILDKIESSKLALRDLDMENKIGKIDEKDYELLKDELLDEWQESEEEYKKITKKKND